MRKDELYRRQLNLARFKLQEQEETAPAKPLRQKRPLDLIDPMYTHNKDQAKLRGESGLISPEAAEKIQRRLLAAHLAELETEKAYREDQTSFGQRLTQAGIDTADQVLDTTAMAAYLTPMPYLGVGIHAAHAAVKKFNAEVTYANDTERKKAALDASRDKAFQAAFGAAFNVVSKVVPPIVGAIAPPIARATARVVPKITPEVVKKVVVPVAQATARTARATGKVAARTARATGKVAARVGKAAIETPLGQAGMRAGGMAATKVQSTRELLNLPLGAVIPQARAKRFASALNHAVDNFIPDTEIIYNKVGSSSLAELFPKQFKVKNGVVTKIDNLPLFKHQIDKLNAIRKQSKVVERSPEFDWVTNSYTTQVGVNPRPLGATETPPGFRDLGHTTVNPANIAPAPRNTTEVNREATKFRAMQRAIDKPQARVNDPFWVTSLGQFRKRK